jgi:hypothetical protein
MNKKIEPRASERWWCKLKWEKERPLTLYEVLDITPRSVLLHSVYDAGYADTKRYLRQDVIFAEKAEKAEDGKSPRRFGRASGKTASGARE